MGIKWLQNNVFFLFILSTIQPLLYHNLIRAVKVTQGRSLCKVDATHCAAAAGATSTQRILTKKCIKCVT